MGSIGKAWTWIPWGSFVVLTASSLGLLVLVNPTLERIHPPLVIPEGVQAGSFAAASLAWAGLMVGALVSVLVLYVMASAMTNEVLVKCGRSGRRALLAPLVAAGVVLLLILKLPLQNALNDFPVSEGFFGYLAGPIVLLGNGLTILAIAALFQCSSVIMRFVAEHDTGKSDKNRETFDWLQQRTRILLWTGAVALVFGTLEIGALNGLAGRAVRLPSPEDEQEMVKVIDAVAVNKAAFWGLVFTLILVLSYLPTTIVILTGRMKAGLRPTESAKAKSWGEQFTSAIAPLTSLLTALAPLLAGRLSEIMLKFVGE